jgi:hypothetical protein
MGERDCDGRCPRRAFGKAAWHDRPVRAPSPFPLWVVTLLVAAQGGCGGRSAVGDGARDAGNGDEGSTAHAGAGTEEGGSTVGSETGTSDAGSSADAESGTGDEDSTVGAPDGGIASRDGGGVEAGPTGGCLTSADCPTGQNCLFAVGYCDAQGHCYAPDMLGPVCNHVVAYCGCDGSTVGGICGPPYAFAPTTGSQAPCGPPPTTTAPGATLTTLARVPLGAPQAIAVDGVNVYFATVQGDVMKVPVAGGSLVTLASQQATPAGIAVDGTNVYWTNAGAGTGSVMKVPAAGGAPTTLATIKSSPYGIAVDPLDVGGSPPGSASWVYWVDIESAPAVMKVPVAGGSPVTLASASSPSAIAVRAGTVYYTDGDNLMSVPAAGGTPVTLATGQPLPASLGVDATSLYWSNVRGVGTIMKMPLGGSAPTMLASSTGAARIAVDATGIDFTSAGPGPNDGAVLSLPLSGGAPTTLVTGQSAPEAIALDATSAYWVDTTVGAVMKLTPKH